MHKEQFIIFKIQKLKEMQLLFNELLEQFHLSWSNVIRKKDYKRKEKKCWISFPEQHTIKRIHWQKEGCHILAYAEKMAEYYMFLKSIPEEAIYKAW